MTKVKFDSQLLGIMQMFGKITRADLKDCYMDEVSKRWTFIVKEGEMSKAIGKAGANVQKLERLLKCRVKIVEFSEDITIFLSRMLHPLKITSVEQPEDGVYLIHAADHKTRGFIIGRAASALRNLEKNMRRFFDVQELKVA